MHPLLAECRWPALGAPFDGALREAVDFVLSRFDVLGLIATGTIVRGNPDPTSDIDLVVVHPQPFRQRIQKVFCGVAAEIFVNPPHTIRGYFRSEHAEARPVTAHMIATGHVLLARDPVFDELRTEAQAALSRAPDVEPETLNRRRYEVATRLEDARDRLTADPDTASLMLGPAVVAMLRFRMLAAGHFLPRDKDLLGAVERLDPDGAALARRLLRSSDVDERFDLADRLADRTIGVRGFYEWDSGPEPQS